MTEQQIAEIKDRDDEARELLAERDALRASAAAFAKEADTLRAQLVEAREAIRALDDNLTETQKDYATACELRPQNDALHTINVGLAAALERTFGVLIRHVDLGDNLAIAAIEEARAALARAREVSK